MKWPGSAAVIVSIIHIVRGSTQIVATIDDEPCEEITAFLTCSGIDDDPNRLSENAAICGKGSELYDGNGFVYSDGANNTMPIAEINNLIAASPRSKERIRPYIGGEEVNGSPTHLPNRYVIDFEVMSEKDAQQYPELFELCRQRVAPERMTKARDVAAAPWWQHWRSRIALYKAIRRQSRTLVASRVQPHWSVALLPTKYVFSDALVVFAYSTYASFAVLQSRIHEVWARFFSSSMKDDLRYTPSDCFETFPFPESWESDAALESAGKAYYEFRARPMVETNLGLTKTYNRFHDPAVSDAADPKIAELRRIHLQMDRAVLAAYRWPDLVARLDADVVQAVAPAAAPAAAIAPIPATSPIELPSSSAAVGSPIRPEFILDYEEEEDEDAAPSEKKKPWRLRFPDPVRDDLLARLLALKAFRAAAERREESDASGQAKTKKQGGATIEAVGGVRKRETTRPKSPRVPTAVTPPVKELTKLPTPRPGDKSGSLFGLPPKDVVR